MTLPEKRLFSEIQFDSQQLASMVHVVPSNFPQLLQTWTHEMAMSGTKKLPRRRAKGDDRIRLMVPHCKKRAERGGCLCLSNRANYLAGRCPLL